MFRPTSAPQSYLQVATQTASPGQLVLMLFDGALRFLDNALEGFKKDDPLEFNETINNNVLRAQAIISELNLSLNMEAGGEFSANLRRLYDYLDRRLFESNFKKEQAGITETVRHLTQLREAWAEMLQKNSSADPAAGFDTATFRLPETAVA